MKKFLELHSIRSNDTILVNIDSIAAIAADNYSRRHAQVWINGTSEPISVKQNLQVICKKLVDTKSIELLKVE